MSAHDRSTVIFARRIAARKVEARNSGCVPFRLFDGLYRSSSSSPSRKCQDCLRAFCVQKSSFSARRAVRDFSSLFVFELFFEEICQTSDITARLISIRSRTFLSRRQREYFRRRIFDPTASASALLTIIAPVVLTAVMAAAAASRASWKEEHPPAGGGGRGLRRVAGGEGWHERKRKENAGERERKDSVRPGAWVEARTRTTVGNGGCEGWQGRGWRPGEREGTGTGTRERRNTNRLDVDGGVGVGPDMAEASRLPEVAKEMKCLPAGVAATPGSFYCRRRRRRPSVPSHRNRRSSPGFPEFYSFQGAAAGAATMAAQGKGGRGEIASNLRQVRENEERASRDVRPRVYSGRCGNRKRR